MLASIIAGNSICCMMLALMEDQFLRDRYSLVQLHQVADICGALLYHFHPKSTGWRSRRRDDRHVMPNGQLSGRVLMQKRQ